MTGDPAPFVELVAPDAAATHAAAWRDLSGRAAEPNVFAEPEFVIPALRCFSKHKLRVLFVWRDAARRAMIGMMALRLPASGFGVARVWQCNQAALPAMMFDRDAIDAALQAALAGLAREQPRIAGVLAPTLEKAGPAASALEALARRANLALRALHPRQRAVLSPAKFAAQGIDARLEKKRTKEWARLRRRLAEGGALTFAISSDVSGIEPFLALEAQGWKGARGTALSADPVLALFTRGMLQNFAASGRLAIHRLDRAGTPVAIGLVLRGDRRAFYWKTAYDETFAAYSPGVQLTLDLSRALERDAFIALTDSCAISDHPMIDRLWPARLELIDCVIATKPGAATGLSLWLKGEELRLGLREAAKRLVNKLRARYSPRAGRGG